MATATGVFFLSLTAIPISYSLNLLKNSLADQWTVFIAGTAVLAVITFITYLIVRFTQKQNKPTDIAFYGKWIMVLGDVYNLSSRYTNNCSIEIGSYSGSPDVVCSLILSYLFVCEHTWNLLVSQYNLRIEK